MCNTSKTYCGANLIIKGAVQAILYIFFIIFFKILFAYLSKGGVKILETLRWDMAKKKLGTTV